jgi:hypothetical protein
MNKIKILAIIGDNRTSAGKYHRLTLPLEELNNKIIRVEEEDKQIEIDFIDSFNPPIEILEKYNIIWNHFSCNIPFKVIGELQSKGVLFFEDIDDFWELPKKTIMKHIPNRRYDNVPILSGIADVSICATNRLATHLIPYSSNLAVSYNDLPIGRDQFMVRDNVKVGDKVAIGIVGSASHLPDYQSIAKVIKRITLNKNLKDKCKFVIGGFVKGDKIWEDILSIFNINGFEIELRPAKDVRNYMSLYEGINILLAPLSDVEFNRKKSGLKVLEASIYNIPVVTNSLYAEKEFNGVVVVKNDKGWIDTLEILVKDDYFIEVGKQMGEINRNLSNFDGRVENLRLLVEAGINGKLVSKLDNLDIYSIKYLEEQNVEYQSYLNTNKDNSWRFEYSPMMEIIPKVEKEYVGILSWKFLQKTGLAKNLLYNMIKPSLKMGNIDIINLSPRKWNTGKEYMEFSEKQHPGLEHLLKLVCLKLGVTYNPNPKNIVYSNFFILRTSLYKEYVEEWIKPALDCLEGEFWTLANQDANYIGGLSKEDLKLHTNLDYYNMITFVLERLILQFIETKKLKIKNI